MARLRERIRGFGHVELASLREARRLGAAPIASCEAETNSAPVQRRADGADRRWQSFVNEPWEVP